MSFSENIKEEILKSDCRGKGCSLAFIKGLASFTMTECEEGVSFLTDGEETGKKLSYMLKKELLGCDGQLVRAGIGRGGRCFRLSYTVEAGEKILLALSDKNKGTDGDFFVDTAALKTQQEQRFFAMGAYLGGGFTADPEKIYHLEFSAKRERAIAELGEVFALFEETPKTTLRNGYSVMYFKNYDSIENVLNILGAHKSLMELANVKIEKEEKNRLNRQVNFEVANIQKTSSASNASIEDIENIMYTVGLDALPEPLQEMALFRLANPEESLAGLAKLSGLSRSGVNHRLKKLSEIARNL